MFKKILFAIGIFAITNGYSQEVTVAQKLPASATPGTDITVEVYIFKGAISGFMKFYQEMPDGFTATVIESKGGSFTFADGGVKIVWISPPADTAFTISYKVSIPPGTTGTKVFGGKVSYVYNNESKRIELLPWDLNFGGSTGTSPKPTNNTPVTKTETETPKTEVTTSGTPKYPETLKTEVPKTEAPKAEVKKEIKPVPIVATTTTVPTTAAAGAGKTYKVQIGAFSAKPKIDGVTEISTLVLDNGITKYYSGNFSNYDDAVKRRNEVVEKGFKGAFIVSFENGKIVK